MSEPSKTDDPIAPAHRRAAEETRSVHRHRRAARRKSLILRGTAVLPALCTLLNGLCGFAAIHWACKDRFGDLDNVHYRYFEYSAWLIFGAMLFDMLDGRLARWARRTSDFGAQLDSLCDAVSFGLAPGVLMLRATVTTIGWHREGDDFQPNFLLLERGIWCVAALYMACAILRLARFNVENEPDESAHMNFKGLPSPGAAAVVASLSLLFAKLNGSWLLKDWMAGPAALAAVSVALPVATLLAALLMVSRFRYAHVINQYIRGKRPFSYLVKLIVIGLACWLIDLFVTAAVVTLVYALSGPVGAIWRKFRKPKGEGGAGRAPTGASPPA
ncbi:MAG: phosphatidylcholine/phosphatidylserine synthase [Phycisphaerae bacterium]